MVEACRRHGGGLFVLALTSNKEGPEVQHARTGDGTVAGTVLAHLRAANAGAEPVGSFGAVVGATIGDTEEDLDINGPLLVPGFGAQGGTVDDMARIFGRAARWALPSSSRDVLRAGPDVRRAPRRRPARQRRRARLGGVRLLAPAAPARLLPGGDRLLRRPAGRLLRGGRGAPGRPQRRRRLRRRRRGLRRPRRLRGARRAGTARHRRRLGGRGRPAAHARGGARRRTTSTRRRTGPTSPLPGSTPTRARRSRRPLARSGPSARSTRWPRSSSTRSTCAGPRCRADHGEGHVGGLRPRARLPAPDAT